MIYDILHSGSCPLGMLFLNFDINTSDYQTLFLQLFLKHYILHVIDNSVEEAPVECCDYQ